MKLNTVHLLLLFPSIQAFAPPRNIQLHPTTRSISPTKLPTTPTQLSALPYLDEETSQKLILLTFEKAIDAGIPALFFIVTAWWIVGLVRGGDDEERGSQ